MDANTSKRRQGQRTRPVTAELRSAAQHELLYEGNDKHKKPWQPGRKGSLCPSEISVETAQSLLLNSLAEGEKRYGVHNGRAFCAQRHLGGRWHGYPVGWVEVPYPIRKKFRDEGVVRKRDISQHWQRV